MSCHRLDTRYACLIGLTLLTAGALIAKDPPPPKTVRAICPPGKKVHSLQAATTGEQLEGPVCVSVDVNALRWITSLGFTIAFTPGPSPQPSPPSLASQTNNQVNLTGAGDLDDQINEIRDLYRKLQEEFAGDDNTNTQATIAIAQSITALKNLVNQSDDLFASPTGAKAVLLAAASLKDQISQALRKPWVNTEDLTFRLKILQTKLTNLLIDHPNATDRQRKRISDLQAAISGTISAAATYLVNGDQSKTFYSQRGIVVSWRDLIQGLSIESFTVKAYVGCNLLYNQNKQVTIRLLQSDRLKTLDGEQPGTPNVVDPFVTVTCSSPIAVSAGIEFSFLATDTFGLVPTGDAGKLQFQVTEHDKVSPLPIGMVHVRLGENHNRKLGGYATFGVAAHVQGNGSGGSSAEYLTGLSVGLFRTVFVTAGWHLGKVSKLGGGYKINSDVPANVMTAPVTSSYQSGFGLAVTFSKP